VSSEDIEPVRGLPDELPKGERMLWQGSPDWRGVARRAFHWRGVAIYFLALLAWRVGSGLTEGESATAALTSASALMPLAALCLAILVALAVLTARSAIYTITDRRVVLRIGIALSMTINLPYRQVDGATLRRHADGTGDIALDIAKDARLAFLMLWPHVRPWRLRNPQPMLRSIPQPDRVARLLGEALARSADQPVQALAHGEDYRLPSGAARPAAALSAS
jgi:hypothetical protein